LARSRNNDSRPEISDFPLQEAEMHGIPLRVPAKAEEVCAFLYGPSWRTPARKGAGYEMKIVDSRPQFIQKIRRDRGHDISALNEFCAARANYMARAFS
jgi:hypothetical protein